MAKLVELKATLTRYLENAYQEEGARQHSTQQSSFAALVAEVVGLKAALSSAPESRKKKQSKPDPSQLLDLAAAVADIVEIKATMAKQHAEMCDKISMLIIVLQCAPSAFKFGK